MFGTIVENIKSFFQTEEELEQQPKEVPDAAIELYEKPITKEHSIVKSSLPLQAPLQKAKLPVSSEQMKARLAKESPPQPSAPAPVEEDITSQIAEFEQAMSVIPSDAEAPAVSSSKSSSPKPSSQTSQRGYFDSLAEQLKSRGYDGVQLQNILESMRLYHEQRTLQVRHHEKEQELERALTHKLTLLQGLEREWVAKGEEIDAASERLQELEVEIDERTKELQALVGELHSHAAKELVAPSASVATDISSVDMSADAPDSADDSTVAPADTPPHAQRPPSPVAVSAEVGVAEPVDHSFILRDGRHLLTIGDLHRALPLMDDSLFYYHVTPERNDFADWIATLFGEWEVAERVRHAANKYEMARLLDAF